MRASTFLHLFRIATLSLSFVTLTIVACSNDTESIAFGNSGGRSGGVSESTGTSGSGTTSRDAAPVPEVPSPPYVLCGPANTGDAADDAGDASSGDAEAGVSSPPTSVNCEDPPDDCIDSVWAARYSSGRCESSICRFDASLVRCPRGCFRQVDGGDKCNE